MYLEAGQTWDGWFKLRVDPQHQDEQQDVLMIYNSVKDELKVRSH